MFRPTAQAVKATLWKRRVRLNGRVPKKREDASQRLLLSECAVEAEGQAVDDSVTVRLQSETERGEVQGQVHGTPFGWGTQGKGREPLTLSASRLGGRFDFVGRGRLLLREVLAGGVSSLGRDDPRGVLDLGGARELLAEVAAKRLGVDADFGGERGGRDAVGHGAPFVCPSGTSIDVPVGYHTW